MPYQVRIRISNRLRITPEAFILFLSLVSFVPFAAVATAQTPVPHIFYSDLESGPNSGGENNAGAHVTVYGKNFGATRGSSFVSIGGGQAVAYPIWTDTRITFQLGATAQSGNILVNTSAGASNAVPFTVRAGNIYYVSTTGSDANPGSFASPWKTLIQARNTIKSGDTVYGMNGVTQATDDGEGWNADFTLRGQWCSASGPARAFVAYPGATVTIGNANETNQSMSGLRTTDADSSTGACLGNWVFAGLNFRGTNPASLAGGSNWRFAGNDISCPNALGNGGSACFETSQASDIKFLGNNVHDAGATNASALFHGVYFSTDTNHIEMAYNTVANIKGCRGIQTHSSPLFGGGTSDPTGSNMYDISIHDNLIHDTMCDGIVLATIDPSKGKVEVYNNVIYNAGKGPNNPEQSGNWSCIYVPGTTNRGPAGSGTVDLYNNTIYNCGSFASPPWGDANNAVENGGDNPNIRIRMRNNLIFQPGTAPYLTNYGTSQVCADGQNCPGIYGSNNLFFGNGPAPANPNITGSLNVDPKFMNAGQFDFRLAAGSPAGSGGVPTSQLFDFAGVAFGSSYPMGAFALGTGTGVTPISVSVSPSSIALTGGQTQTFTTTVSGTSVVTVNWSLSPAVGTLSGGVYTAPATIAAAQTVTITATLAADPAKFATAAVSLTPPVKPTISLTPASATLNVPGQTVQFTATVNSGAAVGIAATAALASPSILWSLNPAVGTLSSSGLYTAPATITSSQKITATASLATDSTVNSSASITVNPPASISVKVNPPTASLTANQTQQFSAVVTGTSSTAVNWSLSGAGVLSASGFYTAPSSFTTQQTVLVTAKLISDPTKTGSASITLNTSAGTGNTSGYSVSFKQINPTSLQLDWIAPAQRPFSDWVALTSPGAPAWWNQWQQNTNGATRGTAIVPMPTGPGQFEFRYFKAGTYTQAAISTSFSVNTNGFGITASPSPVVHGGTVTLTWVAPAGRPTDDWIGLYTAGAPGDNYRSYVNTNGTASGRVTFRAPATAGTYELRYMVNGYDSVQSIPLIVQ